MRLKNILKSSAVLALALTLTLASCGTAADESIEPASEAATVEETETFSLIGTWRSRTDTDSSYYEAVVSSDSNINIYYFYDSICYLYWAGSFDTSAESNTVSEITSSRSENTDTICADNELLFILHRDGRLFFYDNSKYDTPVSVYLNYITNAYIEEYDVAEYADVEPEVNAPESNINANAAQDTTGEENTSKADSAAQNDIPATVIEDNSADTTTSKNSTNNTDADSSVSADDTSEYTYTDEDKTMYAINYLNVRSGPSTAYDVITSYSRDDTVHVTGKCNETGWSRVDIDGITGYVDSYYLSYDKPEAKAVTISNGGTENNNALSDAAQEQKEDYVSGGFPLYNYEALNGQYLGRVRIPSVGVNAAIYNTMAQSVCDAVDSACFTYAWNPPAYCNYTIMLADHSNQGFNAIKSCTVGCVMYIDGVDGNTYKYTCDRIDLNGTNSLEYLYDSAGNRLDKTSGVWAYTCNQDWTHVSLVHFCPC